MSPTDDKNDDPSKHPPDPQPREDDHTVIIGSEDPTDSPAPGYSIQPRPDALSASEAYDETATEEDFIVLLPEAEGAEADATITDEVFENAPQALSASDTHAMTTDDWGGSGGWDGAASTEAPPLTEFLEGADSFGGATGDGPRDTEQIGLLSSHPAFLPSGTSGAETTTMEPFSGFEDVEGLPDLENVEDITALVDQVETQDLASPAESIDFSFRPRMSEKKKISLLFPLTAAAALVVAGVFYGPVVYEHYLRDTLGTSIASAPTPTVSNPTVSNPTVSNPAIDPSPTVDPVGPTPVAVDPVAGGEDPSPVTPVLTPVPPVEAPFRQWVVEAVADNLGVRAGQ